MNDENRLIELESKVAYQDQAIADLGDEIYRQQQQIKRLEDQCRQLLARLETLATAAPAANPVDEVPPHY